MKLKILVLLALVFGLNPVLRAQQNPTGDGTPRGYLVGPGDILTIKVLGEPDFNVEAAVVDEDGKIQVPFNDEGIAAKCRTEKELRADVSKFLTKYLKNPQVSVYVKERHSRPAATVYGEVVNPQNIVLTRKATLQELIALSGGIKKEASGMIQITRTQPLMCEETADDNWNANGEFPSRLYSTKSLAQVNPIIYPGDIIDVQKASPIYIVGEVIEPGEKYIPEGGLPLTQAIAMARGTTREARIKEVKVYRRKQASAQQDIITVDYEAIKNGKQKDFVLEPLDIIEVGKAKKSISQILLEIATGGVRSTVNTLPVRVL
ncbi:MAG: SLBB domain-containing protein [Acidobacteria bacterium]|nr:SLBB domain-containing protein [Acidobacteriota bacterium]